MENHKEVELPRDWSSMPTEILEEFCKLLTIPNQVRFSSVCKTWLSANTSKKAYHWIPHAPWLVSKNNTNAQFQVISNTDKQSYKISKPLLGTSIVGSCKGWLVLRFKFKFIIVNLFSELQLDLPSLSSLSCSICSKVDKRFYIHLPFSFAISTCPNMNPTSVAMVTYTGCLGWCKVGDTAWKCHHTSGEFYAGVAFHNDKLYVVDRHGKKVNMFKYNEGVLVQVGSVESTKPSENSLLPGPIVRSVYLVECGGRVLVVRKIIDYSEVFIPPTVNFVISVVDENSSTPQLVKVQSLDNHILFMANSNIECVDAKYCPEFQRDCVYFTWFSKNNITTQVREFSVAKGTILRSFAPMSPHMQSSFWVLPRFPFDCDCEECTSAPWINTRGNEEKS